MVLLITNSVLLSVSGGEKNNMSPRSGELRLFLKVKKRVG
jgi:hypothetical protein